MKPALYRSRTVLCLAMALSRRQFFRSLVPGDPQSPKRLARYETLETYVRTQLLPYDFELTEDQERELLAEIRGVLEKTPNNDLFEVVRSEEHTSELQSHSFISY